MVTNKEKFREDIENIVFSGDSFGVFDGKIKSCYHDGCGNCCFVAENDCYKSKMKWLQEEYQEHEVDWSKVHIDTKILVSDDGETWFMRYFAEFENGKVFVWNGGNTSFTSSYTSYWKYAKLYEGDE